MCKAALVCAPPCAQWKEREMGLLESECFDVIIGRDTLRFLDPPLAAYFLPDFNHLPLGATPAQSGPQSRGKVGLACTPIEGPLTGHKVTLSEIRLQILQTLTLM